MHIAPSSTSYNAAKWHGHQRDACSELYGHTQCLIYTFFPPPPVVLLPTLFLFGSVAILAFLRANYGLGACMFLDRRLFVDECDINILR